MHIGICLEMIYTDRPFLERIARVADDGCTHAECWFVDGTFNGSDCATDPKDPEATAGAALKAGISLTNTVVGSPDGSLGGGLIDPDTRGEWLSRTKQTLAFNTAAGIPASIVCTGNTVPGMQVQQMTAAVIENLKPTVELAERAGVTLLLEPLNTRVDHEGYLVHGSTLGAEIVRAVGSERLRLLFDCYHMQIMEGDLWAHLEASLDVLGHVHAAGAPGRHELFLGEINYPFLIRKLTEAGYTGVFAMEYTPTTESGDSLRTSLGWLHTAGQGTPHGEVHSRL